MDLAVGTDSIAADVLGQRNAHFCWGLIRLLANISPVYLGIYCLHALQSIHGWLYLDYFDCKLADRDAHGRPYRSVELGVGATHRGT